MTAHRPTPAALGHNVLRACRSARLRVVLLRIMLLAFIGLAAGGCGVKLIRPRSVSARDSNPGTIRRIHYRYAVITTHSKSFWDLQQVKDNVVGLTEFEVVRVLDILLDAGIPGHEHRPVETGIERWKDIYAHTSGWLFFDVLGGLFTAIAPEKAAYGRGYGYFPRVVYLTDWLQQFFGAFNRVGGYAVPGAERLVPGAATAPVNRGVDWLQNGAIGAYIYVIHGLDYLASGGIGLWQGGRAGVVGLLVAPWTGRAEVELIHASEGIGP